jgi:heterogeneous nuclear ribonucleoprotein L
MYLRAVSVSLNSRPSKQITLHDIREPFDLPDGSPSFRDYVGSRNQRFSTMESAQRNRLVRPANVLHWYNAPATMTEERLKEVWDIYYPKFANYYPVFSYLPKRKHQYRIR